MNIEIVYQCSVHTGLPSNHHSAYLTTTQHTSTTTSRVKAAKCYIFTHSLPTARIILGRTLVYYNIYSREVLYHNNFLPICRQHAQLYLYSHWRQFISVRNFCVHVYGIPTPCTLDSIHVPTSFHTAYSKPP